MTCTGFEGYSQVYRGKAEFQNFQKQNSLHFYNSIAIKIKMIINQGGINNKFNKMQIDTKIDAINFSKLPTLEKI